MTTIYRTRTKQIPGDETLPDFWQVELMTQTETTLNVEFIGEFFEEKDAEAIAAAWRSEKTRAIVWLCASLQRAAWGEDVVDEGE